MTPVANLNGLIDGVMHTPVVTIGAAESLRDASVALRDRNVGTLAVVNGLEVSGIISERDVVRALADGADPDKVTVGVVMSRDPRYLTAGEAVTAAMDVMLAAEIRHLPVFDEGQLIGMVSMRDLIGALRC